MENFQYPHLKHWAFREIELADRLTGDNNLSPQPGIVAKSVNLRLCANSDVILQMP